MTNNKNSFSLGAQVGGPDASEVTRRDEQDLRDAMNKWEGDYTNAIREFAFILRVDGRFHKYTEEWNIYGAQPPKRKKDWLEVEIGVPAGWWQEDQGKNYKNYLVTEIEKGLQSMIDLLQQKKHSIKAADLLADWRLIKGAYLGSPAPERRPN